MGDHHGLGAHHPALEQSPAGRREQQAGLFLLPSPCSPWLRGGSWPQHLSVTSRKEQPPNRTTTGTGQDGSAKTRTGTHTHTHTYTGRESRWTHTYWNCSRCHWCLMSRPLQSNQRDPLQKEHGQEARGHPGCHPARLSKGRTALVSRKTCSPAPTGTSLCHMGKGGIFHPLLGTRGHAGDASRRTQGGQEGLPGRREGTGLPRPREGGCTARRMLAGEQVQHAHSRQGGHGCASTGMGSLPLGMGLGRTETRQ